MGLKGRLSFFEGFRELCKYLSFRRKVFQGLRKGSRGFKTGFSLYRNVKGFAKRGSDGQSSPKRSYFVRGGAIVEPNRPLRSWVRR